MNKWVFLYLSIRLFVDGSEDYIMQSTAWYYMEYLGKPKVFLGLTLAAFAAATCILAPLVAMIEVKFDAATVIVFVSGPVKLIGNILYAIPVNGYFPLFGRLISGMGESTLGVLYGAVTKCTDKTNRAEAFLYFEGLYSFGAIFGPAIGSVLVFNINILGWKINPGNSPGVLLAIAWVFLITLYIFLPSDLAENSVAEEIEQDTDSDESSGNENTKTETIIDSPSIVCCLYLIIFLSTLFYDMISFFTPLIAVYNLGLTLVHVKLIYVNSSLAVFILYVATYRFLHKTTEKKFLFVALFSAIILISIMFYFAVVWKNCAAVNNAYLLLLSMCIMSVQLISFALACSLLSKVTPPKKASFYQSLIVTTDAIGIISARVIAGATFKKIPMMCTCLAFVISWAIAVIWMAIEYKNLPPKAAIKG